MALNLNDDQAVDYSDGTELLPFDAYGEFDLTLLSYVESGPAGTDTNPGDKEYDLATVKVLKSNNEAVRVGETIGLFFQTGGDGITVKSRPYAAGRLRQFMAACVGDSPKPPFDGNAVRKALLETDLSGGGARVHLSRREKLGKGEYEGRSFPNDKYSPLE